MSADDPRSRVERLDAALTALEAAVARSVVAERTHADLAVSLAAMEDDRQRLAANLDAALARTARMTDASEQVEQRLTAAAQRLGALLDDTGAA